MAAQQVRDVLARMRSLHNRLSRSFDEIRQDSDDHRVRSALRCMTAHEKQLRKWVEDIGAHADDGILNTWIQFAPGFALDQVLEEHAVTADMDPEEILTTAVALDQALLGLYRRLVDSASAPRVKEMFENLLQLVEIKDLQFTRTAVEMVDE